MRFILVLCIELCGGNAFLINENRPQEQWVAKGSPSLMHYAYINEIWPSTSRFNFFIATCNESNTEFANCNVLQSDYIKEIYHVHQDIMEIEVDLDQPRIDNLELSQVKLSTISDSDWKKFQGSWSFNPSPLDEEFQSKPKHMCVLNFITSFFFVTVHKQDIDHF